MAAAGGSAAAKGSISRVTAPTESGESKALESESTSTQKQLDERFSSKRERNVILDIRNGRSCGASGASKSQSETNEQQVNVSKETKSSGAQPCTERARETANINRLPSFGTLPQRVLRQLPYFSYAGKTRNIDLELSEQRKRSAQVADNKKLIEEKNIASSLSQTESRKAKERSGRNFSNISNIFSTSNNNSNNTETKDNRALQNHKQVSGLIEAAQKPERVSICQRLLGETTRTKAAMNRRNSFNARQAQQVAAASATGAQQVPQYQRYNSSPLRTPPMYGRSTLALPVGGVGGGGSQRRLGPSAEGRVSRDNLALGGAGVRAPRPASATGNFLAPGQPIGGVARDFASARGRARSTASLYHQSAGLGAGRHAHASWLEPAMASDPYGTNMIEDVGGHLYYDDMGTPPDDGGGGYLYGHAAVDYGGVGGGAAGYELPPPPRRVRQPPPPHSLYTSPVSPISGGGGVSTGARRGAHLAHAGAPNGQPYYNGASRFSVYESTRDGLRTKLAPAGEQLRRILGTTKALNKPRPVHLHPQWAYTRPFIHLLSASALSSPEHQLGHDELGELDDGDELGADDEDADEGDALSDDGAANSSCSSGDENGEHDHDDDDDDHDEGVDDETAQMRRRRRRRRQERRERARRRLRKRRLRIDENGYDIGPQYLPFNRLQDSQAIRAVDFHPSGQVYAVGSNTRTLRICAYPAEHELRQFGGAQAVVAATSQSASQQVVPVSAASGAAGAAATAAAAGSTHAQQVPSPRVLFKFLQLHRGSIYCVSFNAQGNLLATGSNDQTIHLVRYNSTTHNPDGDEFRLTMHDGTVRDLCFVDDHTSGSALLLSAGGGDNKIYVTDCDTVTPFQSMAGHTQPVMALHHCGGAQFVSGSQDRTVRFWDLRTRQCTSIISAPPMSSQVSSAASAAPRALAHMGQAAAAASATTKGAAAAATAHSHRGHIGIGPGAPVCTVRVDPSGRLLASGHSDSTCMLYDVRGARIIQTFRPHDDEVRTLSFSPKSYYLLSGGYDNRLVVTDLQGNLTQPLPSACVAQAHDKIVQARWHPNDFTFVATSADKSATLYALPSDS